MSFYTEISIRADIGFWACLAISQIWLSKPSAWGLLWLTAALACRIVGWWADRPRMGA